MTQARRGYPLGALFVLITICAVLVAGIAPLVQSVQHGQVSSGAFVAAMAIGATCGIILGMILGLFQFRIGRGVLMGVGVGAIIGTAAGAISLLTSDQILAAATAMTAGSGLVVAVAVMMRQSTPG